MSKIECNQEPFKRKTEIFSDDEGSTKVQISDKNGDA